MSNDPKQLINLQDDLVDLASYRAHDRTAYNKPDPLVMHVAYAQDNQIYHNGKIFAVDAKAYTEVKNTRPNDLVNKFGQTYAPDTKLLLHKKLADVLVDTAIDMRNRYGQFTVVMDALRTYDSGKLMEKTRPDLVAAKLLAPAGTSAHNRALAVDSKLFELINPAHVFTGAVNIDMLKEVDEKGHLDDLDMTTSSRFFPIPTNESAYQNRLNRLRAWQRASVKNNIPIANLLAEFWDDRVPGSPSDMWRVLACRAMCIGVDGNPKTNTALALLKMNLQTLHNEFDAGRINSDAFAQGAYGMLVVAWDQVLTPDNKQQLEHILGKNGGHPPALNHFLFHEWLHNIHDHELVEAGFAAQSVQPIQPSTDNKVFVAPLTVRTLH
jgi:hypothetical protein